jgi:hypothetical protein
MTQEGEALGGKNAAAMIRKPTGMPARPNRPVILLHVFSLLQLRRTNVADSLMAAFNTTP